MSAEPSKYSRHAKAQDGRQPVRLTPQTKHAPIPIILVLLLATALRAHYLDGVSFWSDETRSALVALNEPVQIIAGAVADVHSPAFYLIEHYWIKGLGQNDYSIRLLSAFAGLLTVATTFALGKRIWCADTASVAALLVSASAFHLRLTQEARP